jgi:hypothetical protein
MISGIIKRIRRRILERRLEKLAFQDRYVEDLEDAEYNCPGMYRDRLRAERERLDWMIVKWGILP